METATLTDQAYWEAYWADKKLPREVRRGRRSLYLNAILDVLDRYLATASRPGGGTPSVLEIGGSPGQYLAYVHRRFGFEIHCLDYTRIGCEKTRENFRLLDIPGVVHEADLFAADLTLPQFDVVYSLGFIEHFTDLETVVGRHLALLRPGGLLIVGAPNFLGINHWFLSRVAPALLSVHNLAAMDVDNWIPFERRFGLETLFKGYVGGFEPAIFDRCEERTLRNRTLKTVARLLHKLVGRHFRVLRRFNGKQFSGYVLGAYEKPA